MSDVVGGDKIGGDSYKIKGRDNSITIHKSTAQSREELDEAVAELRAFITQLKNDGIVNENGTIIEPGALVTAVESHPGKLRTLRTAVASGAKDAILTAVKDGVATVIVGLTDRMM
ncbi:hypothetical protein [Saccharothrix sp. NRRL B-16314]|uniref:hypothetical protein n=1 Tax=Saccharothrix sp. NRRL B-16314 TaxID=1463825 RepID=UPI0005267275|nr:hypothetical protein [Saccharothrix sp. NRRL B-16314]